MSEAETLQLNCPKCEGAVRVLATAAGRRVRCPRCQAEFKVPGLAAPVDDDDDWLNLDQPLPPAAGASAKRPAASNSPNSTVKPPGSAANPTVGLPPALAGGDLFGGDLPPAPAQADGSSQGDFSSQDWNALQGFLGDETAVGGASGGASHQGVQAGRDDVLAAEDVLGDDDVVGEFRVTCPICASITYARPDQVGKQVKCHDCFSKITVPQPPKPKKVYKPDIENAEVFGMFDHGEPPPAYNGPTVKTASEYLREAEESDDPEEDNRYENPDVKNWLLGIFRIFLDPLVPVHWLLLSILGSVLGALVVSMGHLALMIPIVLMTLLYVAFVFSCGFSIMEAVSTNAKRVDGWPIFDPVELFGQLIVVGAAAGLCMGPPAMLGSAVFGPGLLTVMMVMFALFLLFPFVLLSMLDSDSIFIPFSAEVTKSVTRCQEQWGVLYLSSGLLFFGTFLFYVVCAMLPPLVAAIFVSFATVAALFTYFSMLGRLAYAIGHAVNAPPASDTVKRERRGSY